MSEQPKVPSSRGLCNVLSRAESDNPPRIRGIFLPLLNSIRPKVYQIEQQRVDKVIVGEEIPRDNRLILLISGGIGSVSVLWRLLIGEYEFQPIFVEGLFERELELVRKECIKRVFLESRKETGFPMVDPVTKRIVLKSIIAPDGASILSRRARLALLTSIACEYIRKMEWDLKTTYILWGNVQDSISVLTAMDLWEVNHCVPMKDIESSLFCLTESENISDVIRERFIQNDYDLSPSAILPRNVTNIVCSCWSNLHDTQQPYRPRVEIEAKNGPIYQPFLAMCSNCSGCLRYLDAWKRLYSNISIRIGSKNLQNRDDDRHYENLPTLREEKKLKRLFSEYIIDRKESKDKRKRGKKKKIEEDEEDDEEDKDTKKSAEEDDDDDDEDDEVEEEPEDDNIEIAEEEQDYSIPVHQDEDIMFEDEEEPNFDFDFGDSDGETDRRKKKKKKKIV